MQEESVYNLYAASFPDQNRDNVLQQQKKSLKNTKIQLLQQAHFKSLEKGRTAAELLHLNSKKLLASTFTTQRREHASFGLPKRAYQLQLNDENKIIPASRLRRDASTQREIGASHSPKRQKLPAVPKFGEGPVLGLKSGVDFIDANRGRATSLRPPPRFAETDFLAKRNYGVAPAYLDRVKGVITQEKEYINMIAQVRNPLKATPLQLGKEEVDGLRAALRRRYDKVNKEYQSITHISKVYSQGVKRKKEACEKELLHIERNMKLLEKDAIFVDIGNSER